MELNDEKLEVLVDWLGHEQGEDARQFYLAHVDVLDEVKEVTWLAGTNLMTRAMVAVYYKVPESVVGRLVADRRHELEPIGMELLYGNELRVLRKMVNDHGGKLAPCSQLTVFTKEALLMIGMLLTRYELPNLIKRKLIEMVAHPSLEAMYERFEQDRLESDRYMTALAEQRYQQQVAAYVEAQQIVDTQRQAAKTSFGTKLKQFFARTT